MTEVAFHTGLPDKQAYACRLIRKAWRLGQRVMVTAESAILGQLDQALWVFEHEEFVPHLRVAAGGLPPRHAARTPVWLAEGPLAAANASVLVKLGHEFEASLGSFTRVIELVSSEVDDVAAGRTRWRQYMALGLTPINVSFNRATD